MTSKVTCANLNQERVKLLALLNANVVSAGRDMRSKKRSVAEEAESVKALIQWDDFIYWCFPSFLKTSTLVLMYS